MYIHIYKYIYIRRERESGQGQGLGQGQGPGHAKGPGQWQGPGHAKEGRAGGEKKEEMGEGCGGGGGVDARVVGGMLAAFAASQRAGRPPCWYHTHMCVLILTINTTCVS